MKRLVNFFISIAVLALLGLAFSTSATAVSPTLVVAYIYDAHDQGVVQSYATPERGQPSSHSHDPAANAVYPGSDGASERSAGVRRSANTGYDDPAQGVSGDGTKTDTTEWVLRGSGDPSVLLRCAVAANGGSALADASGAAFKAADGAASWTPSAKHLAGAGGRWQKFAEGVDPGALAQEALRSPGATFLPDKTAGRFIVETDLGRSIGSKGESWLKVVVSDGGDIITGYPVKR